MNDTERKENSKQKLVAKKDNCIRREKIVHLHDYCKKITGHDSHELTKKIEEVLAEFRQTIHLYEGTLENLYDGIFIADRKGFAVFCNRAFEKLTGLSREQIINMNVSEMEEKGFISESIVKKVLNTGRPCTLTIQYPTGRDIVVSAVPYFIDGKLSYVVCSLRDLTELIALKAELEEVRRQLDISKLQLDNIKLEKIKNSQEFIFRSSTMEKVLSLALKVGRVDTTVLILGESGVGKDLLAKFIHSVSERSEGPFVKICCEAIPETLLESELFGYEKGAFTGAKGNGKMGLFELANKGTLFLDEIGELPVRLQTKLLNVLQDRKIMRLGGTKPIDINVRIIAATNRNLERMVAEGKFREDLFFRLNVVPITIPPLRERRNDILPLINHFLAQYNKKYDLKKKLSAAAIDRLLAYNWPGNVRELQNAIERLVVLSSTDLIDVDELPKEILEKGSSSKMQQETPAKEEDIFTARFSSYRNLHDFLYEAEKSMISWALEKTDNQRDAAAVLGIDASTLTRKKQRLGI